MSRPVVIGFVGRSGSGKTTLLERLVPIFRARGLRVAVVKDAHHGFSMDKPGKDSWRYREAGAETVLVRSDERWVLLQETPEERASIETLLAHVGDVDVVLVEGFKNEGDYPKYEVYRPDVTPEGPLFAFSGATGLVGVVSDASDTTLPTKLPVLPLNDPERVAAYLASKHLPSYNGKGI